jgi:hypothetical protein
MWGEDLVEPREETTVWFEAMWSKLEALGLAGGKPKPEMAESVEEDGLSAHIDGKIVISADTFLDDIPRVVLEELVHYVSGYKDYDEALHQFVVKLVHQIHQNDSNQLRPFQSDLFRSATESMVHSITLEKYS